MESMSFCVKLVEALAWPVTVVFVMIFLRKQVKELVPQLTRLKAGPLEAEFTRELTELRIEADQALLPAQRPLQLLTPEQQTLLQLAEVNPRSAILEAWHAVETATIDLIREKHLLRSSDRVLLPYERMQLLGKSGYLDPAQRALYNDLRKLRNQAAHAENFNPSSTAALDYLVLAARIVHMLKARLAEDWVHQPVAHTEQA